VDEDLPGLVIPITDSPDNGVMSILGARSYRIIALDADYISQELIPELARRHFGDGAGEYTIAVIKRGQTDQIVFRSDASVPASALDGGEVTAGFLKILFDEVDRFFFAQLRRPDAGASSGLAVGLRPQLNRQQIAISVAGNIKSNSNKD